MHVVHRLVSLAALVFLATSPGASPVAASLGPGVGNIPQGTQLDGAFAGSFAAYHVTNVFATTQQASCYTPEVPYTVSNGPLDWYSGQNAVQRRSEHGRGPGALCHPTGEQRRVPGYSPDAGQDRSESDIQVDLSKHSGRAAIAARLNELGIRLSEEDLQRVAEWAKRARKSDWADDAGLLRRAVNTVLGAEAVGP